jgi:uncharacterized protein
MGKRVAIQSTGYFDVIKIRAHHLLCMQGFQGYGYSREFKHNLSEIVNYLKKHPYHKLKVVAKADIICKSCPHQEDGCCNRYVHSTSIRDIDLQVLNKLDIREGQIESFQNLLSKVKEVLNTVEDAEEICGGCSWKNKCLWYLNLY